MAKLLSPDRDWSFINRLAAKVRAGRGAPSSKRARLVTSDKLLELGCDVMENAPKRRTPAQASARLSRRLGDCLVESATTQAQQMSLVSP